MAALAVAEVAKAARIGPVYFAVAEADGANHPAWQGWPYLIQSEGDLGHRMERILDQCLQQHGRALLLGADTPQIDVDSLQRAHQWLDNPDPRLVIGSAHDGGFWIFGSNKSLGQGSLSGIRYSQPDTGSIFQATLRDQGDWLSLETQTDVDTLNALQAVHGAMSIKKGLLPQQQALVDWMNRQRF